ncbi:hypothetical protein AB1I39_11005 [Chromobacterium vaccinii]|uniref:hypothetical protein n=1 Tax=Chromobacterium vaccinii TaxID=1108595 RepID=UPI003241C04D
MAVNSRKGLAEGGADAASLGRAEACPPEAEAPAGSCRGLGAAPLSDADFAPASVWGGGPPLPCGLG